MENVKRTFSELSMLADEEIGRLRELGYDADASLAFAKAAKSWCERGSTEWSMWSIAIERLSEER